MAHRVLSKPHREVVAELAREKAERAKGREGKK